MFSTILYGSRQSIAIGVMATLFAGMLGISLGLIAGYTGGTVDAIIMRIALGGSSTIAYDKCALDNTRTTSPPKMLSFREITY